MVLIWTLVYLLMIYFWRMGPPKRRTNATDAVVVHGSGGVSGMEKGVRGVKRVVNLNPNDPNYKLPPSRGGGPPPLEAIRGRAAPPTQPARAPRAPKTYRA